jgi:hypothetical protein
MKRNTFEESFDLESGESVSQKNENISAANERRFSPMIGVEFRYLIHYRIFEENVGC